MRRDLMTSSMMSTGGVQRKPAAWRLPVVSRFAASVINGSIPPLLLLHGLAVRGTPFMQHQLHTFAILMTAILFFCGGTQVIAVKYGARLQPEKRHAFVDGDEKAYRLLWEEVLETTRCM